MTNGTATSAARTVDELRAARDKATGEGQRWRVTAQELQLMIKAGEKSLYRADLEDANLRGAYLEGANLRGAYLGGANLGGANLEGAYLVESIGVYVAFAPHLSSRRAPLAGGVILHKGKIELRFWAGCQQRITAAQLLKQVSKTHADNPLHAAQYKAGIKFIQACFKTDMQAGKWDYLVDWKAPETPVIQEVNS